MSSRVQTCAGSNQGVYKPPHGIPLWDPILGTERFEACKVANLECRAASCGGQRARWVHVGETPTSICVGCSQPLSCNLDLWVLCNKFQSRPTGKKRKSKSRSQSRRKSAKKSKGSGKDKACGRHSVTC